MRAQASCRSAGTSSGSHARPLKRSAICTASDVNKVFESGQGLTHAGHSIGGGISTSYKATVGASLPAQTYRPAVEVGCHPAPCPGGRRVEKSKIRLASPLGVLLLDSYATERMVVGPSANPRAPPRPPHRTKPSVTSKINQRCVNKGAWAGGGTIHHRGARPRG